MFEGLVNFTFSRKQVLWAVAIAVVCLGLGAVAWKLRHRFMDDNPLQVQLSLAEQRTARALFAERCASCHEGGTDRAPSIDALNGLSPAQVERVLSEGVMRPMTSGLDPSQIRLLASWLGRAEATSLTSTALDCPPSENWFDADEAPQIDGFGFQGTHNRREIPLDTPLDVAGMRLTQRWSVPLRGASDIVVAGGGLFVPGIDGTILALDKQSGCVRWRYETGAAIRSGIVMAPARIGAAGAAARAMLYYGDRSGRVIALDAINGELIWEARPHPHPLATTLATPTLFEGKLYIAFSSLEGDVGPAADRNYGCCTFRGMVAALDAADGRVLWRVYTIQNPPQPTHENSAGVMQYGPSGAAVLGSPAIDPVRRRLYFLSDNNYSDPADISAHSIFAVDLDTGARIFQRQLTRGNPHNAACNSPDETNCPDAYRAENRSDWGFRAAPVLVVGSDGRTRLIAAQKSGHVWGLDPDSGELLWSMRLTQEGVNLGALQGIAASDGRLYVPTAEFLSRPDEQAYEGMDELGLYGLDSRTGTLLWSGRVSDDCTSSRCAGYHYAPIAIGSYAAIASNDGVLRFYDGATGRLERSEILPRHPRSGDFVPWVWGHFGLLGYADGLLFITDRASVTAYELGELSESADR